MTSIPACAAASPAAIHPDLRRSIELVVRCTYSGETLIRTGIFLSALETEHLRSAGVESVVDFGFEPIETPDGHMFSEPLGCWIDLRQRKGGAE